MKFTNGYWMLRDEMGARRQLSMEATGYIRTGN